jgi:hypothetical protein
MSHGLVASGTTFTSVSPIRSAERALFFCVFLCGWRPFGELVTQQKKSTERRISAPTRNGRTYALSGNNKKKIYELCANVCMMYQFRELRLSSVWSICEVGNIKWRKGSKLNLPEALSPDLAIVLCCYTSVHIAPYSNPVKHLLNSFSSPVHPYAWSKSRAAKRIVMKYWNSGALIISVHILQLWQKCKKITEFQVKT